MGINLGSLTPESTDIKVKGMMRAIDNFLLLYITQYNRPPK